TVTDDAHSLTIRQHFGRQRFRRLGIQDRDQVRHNRHRPSMMASNEVLVLNLDPKFGLDTGTAAHEYPTPVPAVASLMQYIGDPPIKELASVPTFTRGVEELKNTCDGVEL